MKIINTSAIPQFYLYASPTSGGKTLQPGESSAEVSLQRIHIDIFQQHLLKGKVQIRLNDKEREYLQALLAADKKEIKVAKLPPEPKPLKKPVTPKKKEENVMKMNSNAAIPMGSTLAMAPMTPPIKPQGPAIPVTKEALDKGEVSLSDLVSANSKSSLKDIAGFMGSRV